MGRKSITVDESTKERLAALKQETDTWDDVVSRAADALETPETPETTETQGGDVNTECGQVPDDVLTEAHLSDIQSITERAVEQALANATRR